MRAFTLVEIVVVLLLVGLLMVAVTAGTAQLPSARLKRSATMLISAIRVAYTHATATSRDVRIVMDFDEKKIWIEQGDIPMLVQSKDLAGNGGADPASDAERFAVAEGERVLKGPPIARAHFKIIQVLGFGQVESTSDDTEKWKKKILPGITFRQVQAGHDDAPVTKGRAYLYFWPGGLTERASIQLRIGEAKDADTLTLIVAPLTGKVSLKSGPVDLVKPTDDQTSSDREDTGGF